MSTVEDAMSRIDAQERERQRALDAEFEKNNSFDLDYFKTNSNSNSTPYVSTWDEYINTIPGLKKIYKQILEEYPNLDLNSRESLNPVRAKLRQYVKEQTDEMPERDEMNAVMDQFKEWYSKKRPVAATTPAAMTPTPEMTSTIIPDTDTTESIMPRSVTPVSMREQVDDVDDSVADYSDSSHITAYTPKSILAKHERQAHRRAVAPHEMLTLNAQIDKKIKQQIPKMKKDATVSKIHDFILFYRNSVNVVIGRRGSGKTFSTLREILKLPELDPGNNYTYTQVFYVSDKAMDDTVALLKPLFPSSLQFIWMPTHNALNLLADLGALKAKISNPEYRIPVETRKFYKMEDTVEDARKMLNAEHLPSRVIPHSLVLFDDCLSLFSKNTPLAKKLYENRQIRATIFLILQDVTGLSSSMKSNVNALQLFGSYSRQKFNVLFYQLPPVETQYDDYKHIGASDSYWFDFETGEEIKLKRKPALTQAEMKRDRDRLSLFSD